MNQFLSENHVLCCDWGTSSFRLRLVSVQDYKITAELISQNGVATIYNAWKEQHTEDRFKFYSKFLKECIQELAKISTRNLENVPVIVSGMASSSIGMEELPYASIPYDIYGKNASFKMFKHFNGKAPLMLVSGVKSEEDVMRGEEAQLIGLIKLNQLEFQDSQSLVFVFPGTHSKHIQVENGLIQDFKTFMTGEMFTVFKENSILKDSLSSAILAEIPNESEINAFLQGIERSSKSSILHNLFTVRTNQLFNIFAKGHNLCYLSGLLIGTEVRELKNNEFDQVFVCSGKHLYNYYKLAFDTIFQKEIITFLAPEIIDNATIAGQIQLFNSQYKSSYE
jgi:2-dehydro-3-deoxygalactonokinase